MDKPCPECGKILPVCTCGEWDCGLYAHFNEDCPSTRAAAYRNKTETRKRRIDTLQYLAEAEKQKVEE